MNSLVDRVEQVLTEWRNGNRVNQSTRATAEEVIKIVRDHDIAALEVHALIAGGSNADGIITR